MFATALRNLWAHKVRLLATALSIMLGVAFMAGTLVLTATMRNTFDNLFTDVYQRHRCGSAGQGGVRGPPRHRHATRARRRHAGPQAAIGRRSRGRPKARSPATPG